MKILGWFYTGKYYDHNFYYNLLMWQVVSSEVKVMSLYRSTTLSLITNHVISWDKSCDCNKSCGSDIT